MKIQSAGLLLATAVSLSASQSYSLPESLIAGFFVEPSATYELGRSQLSYPDPFSGSSGSVEGLGIGARAGVHLYDAFFVGLDGRYSMPQFKDSSLQYDAISVATNWGPVAGVQTPYMGLRVWATYILGGWLNPERSGNLDVRFDHANGFRVGAGMRFAVVSVNLEYQQLRYGLLEVERVGAFSPAAKVDSINLENRAWIASVSFPVDL